jgi:WS/DGAT/MGAT family acyltransferase
LHIDGPSQFGHVAGLAIFARPDANDYDPFGAWRERIESRLDLLEPLRRRLLHVPFGLDHPFWIDDPDFDLDHHVHHATLPSPGTEAELAELVCDVIGRPLDRNRPLWEAHVIDGLGPDRFAVLTKLHHATIDGASGAELLTLMLDATPGADPGPPSDHEWRPERLPSDAEVLARAAANLARKPARAVLLAARTVREIGRATRNPVLAAAAGQVRRSLRGPLGTVLNLGRRRDLEPDPIGPLPGHGAPATPFNAAISARRQFAYGSVPLQAVKDIKNALDATVNDVVMAVCAGGVRTWLEAHDALPDVPLIAGVPVSLRTGDEPDQWTNRVSIMLASLPTDEPDPVVRVARVHDSMMDAKQLFDSVPADALTDFAQFPPPAVFALAMRAVTRLSRRYRGPVNLTISNVPGPRRPLYAARAELLHYYPVSTILEGQGLNITVQSYLDTLDFGLVSCRDLVPDLSSMLDAIVDDLVALGAAVGVTVDQAWRLTEA